MEYVALLQWLLGMASLTAVGAPLAAVVFRQFPGRGATMALPGALVPSALLWFWIGQGTFGYHTVVLGVLLTAGASVLCLRRGYTPDWRAVARGFGLFLVGVGFMLSLRVFDPTITEYAGEQFLHYGLMQVLDRTAALPPEDVWFAGEPVRYYYGSQLQVTALSQLTGVSPRLGFNLGIATFFGILLSSAYGVAGAVADARGYSLRLGGALGAVFVAVGGATTTAIRLLAGLLPTDLAVDVARPAFSFAAGRYGIALAEFVADQSSPGTWSAWYTRYVVDGTLQEFPLYTFRKADLYGLPNSYVVVAAGVAVAYLLTPADRRWRRRGLLVVGLGSVAGVVGTMSTWSVPTALGLAGLAVAAGDDPATLLPRGLADRIGPTTPNSTRTGAVGPRLAVEGRRVLVAAVAALVVGLVALVLGAPFLVFGELPVNEGIGLFPPPIPLVQFLVVYGGLLAMAVAFLAWQFRPALDGRAWDRPELGVLFGVAAVTVLAALVVSAVLALLVPLLALGWWLVRTDRAGVETVLLVAGLGLLLSMELVFAKVYHWETAGARWETSLKVSVQAWTVLGLAAGAIGAALLGDARRRLSARRLHADGGGTDGSGVRGLVGPATRIGLVVLVVLASTPFVVLVVADEVGGPLPEDAAAASLDAMERYETERPGELAAVDWLADRPGRPTIVEVTEGGRTWSGHVSAFTGLPTLIGWQGHEAKFRGDDRVAPRVEAVETIYSGDWAAAVEALRTYDVAYIYVGRDERWRYPALTERFENRAGISEAYTNEAVTIYAVDREALRTG